MTDYSFIRFERSGGFTGLTIALDRKSLNADLAEEIRSMMEQSGIAALPAGSKTARPVPDEFTYTLIYLTGEVERTLVLPESELPDSLRPLIRFLSWKARHKTPM